MSKMDSKIFDNGYSEPENWDSFNNSQTDPILSINCEDAETEELLNPGNISDAPIVHSHSNNSSQRNFRLFGSFLAVCSAVTFSFSALLGKLVSHLNSFNVGLWTFLIMTIIAVFLVLFHHMSAKTGETIWGGIYDSENRRIRKSYVFYLWTRSVCGTSALLLFFHAVKYINVGDVEVIDSCSPILVYIMAFIFFGEKFRYLMVLTTVFALCGVALISRPPMLINQSTKLDGNSLTGVALSLSVMFCMTMSVISLKFLDKVHYSIVNFAFGLWGTLQCTVVAWMSGVLAVPTDPWDILKVVSIGVVFHFGQVLLTFALKYQDAGPVGLLRTMEVMFIFIWQWVFLSIVPDVYTWAGGLLILLGALLTIIRNWISSLPETHRLRDNFKYLLL